VIGALAALTIASARAAITVVHIYDFDFSANPPGQPVVNPVINVGDTVRWVWDEGHHSTTAAAGQALSWNSGVHFSPHEFEFTFTLPGVFNYYCLPHGRDNGDGTVTQTNTGLMGFYETGGFGYFFDYR
jgi:hypothetical protein